jgi:hypothetical protein
MGGPRTARRRGNEESGSLLEQRWHARRSTGTSAAVLWLDEVLWPCGRGKRQQSSKTVGLAACVQSGAVDSVDGGVNPTPPLGVPRSGRGLRLVVGHGEVRSTLRTRVTKMM